MQSAVVDDAGDEVVVDRDGEGGEKQWQPGVAMLGA